MKQLPNGSQKFAEEFGDMQKQEVYFPPNHRMTNSQWIHINEKESDGVYLPIYGLQRY